MAPGSEDSESSEDDRQRSTSASSSAVPLTLSAEQIIRILQQNPDLVVELKSQVADRMQQQGTPIDPNEISDDMLYSQIEANADLRSNITTVLRARGYVSQDDLQAAGSTSGTGSSSNTDLLFGQQSLSSPDGMSFSKLAPGAGTETGEASSDQGGIPADPTHSMYSTEVHPGSEQRRGHQAVNASTDLPKVIRQHAPYNLRSMHDLYTQIPEPTASLKRFGSEVFVNRDLSAMARGGSGRDTPLDVPLGPDYIVGPGDTLAINMWGGMTQSNTRVVDRDGRILLPDAGSLDVGGLSLQRVESVIDGALKKQYRNVQTTVTVSRLRSVRVYVVGDVQRPGGYDISSLATPLSALYAAGGPTSVGSLRVARHYRGDHLVEDVDLYEFLLRGIRNGSARFESGDTLLIPPAGTQVAVDGAVKRPAIYEIKAGESTLASVINDAGGFTAAASLGHITIERIDANRERETVTLEVAGPESLQSDQEAIAAFQVHDGDRIRVANAQSISRVTSYVPDDSRTPTACVLAMSCIATRMCYRSQPRTARLSVLFLRTSMRRLSISMCLTC